jgi:two-component system, OmpR family, response regulator
MRILLVEDDVRLATEVARFLQDSGIAVDLAAEGIDALHLAETEPYDAIVLDLGLPGMDGVSILKALRGRSVNTAALVLTARDRFADKAAAFRAGADDYLTKPFQLEELLLRVQALVRRAAGHARPEIRIGPIALDTTTGLATLDEMPVRLTALERRVLTYLMLHPGRTISRTELSEHIYEHDQDRDFNSLEVIVSRLRKKFGRTRIETSRGEGYRLSDETA